MDYWFTTQSSVIIRSGLLGSQPSATLILEGPVESEAGKPITIIGQPRSTLSACPLKKEVSQRYEGA